QIVLLGQYRTADPLHFRITGNYLSQRRTFDLKFDLSSATTRNAFVPRLWASRKIARLIEEITKLGADSAANTRGSRSGSMVATSSAAETDPKMKELVDEIIRLSTEYGILTEYT